MMTSPSPNRLLYSQPSGDLFVGLSSSIGGLQLQQRTVSNAPFQRSITPTSIGGQSFPLGLQQQQQASPNRSLFNLGGSQPGLVGQMPGPTSLSSQIKRTNPASSGFLSSTSSSTLTSISAFSRPQPFPAIGTDRNQPSLDLSEFPTLGNRSAPPPNPLPGARNYGKTTGISFEQVNMVNKPVQEPAPEFQIQQEDFPALPGAQNPPSSTAGDSARKTPTSLSGSGPYDLALKDSTKFFGDKTNSSQQKRGIQTHGDGTVSNIPAGMVTDQFGMVGLLTFIRAAETDPNLVALAPGIDLTTLGLNLNSPDNLYSTFQSPWADAPCRPQDIDFHVPSEYLTNIIIRDKLAPIKLNRYGEDLLFFLFYMNGGDVLQLAAAAELYNRDWRYHKEERIWITRAHGFEPLLKTSSYERGTYYFFDAQSWRKVAKEFYLEYDKLEDRPHLPPTLHHNAGQTPTVMSH